MIPTIIWTYWNSSEKPQLVKDAIQTWVQNSDKWQINVLHSKSSVVQELQLRDGISIDSHAFFADWLRLALLEKYGGVWLDGSIFLNDPQYLPRMHAEACLKRVEIAGFEMSGYQTLNDYPVLENWMLLSPPRSPFISSWRQEHLLAIKIGFSAYKAQIQLEKKVDPQKIYYSSGTYLTQHVCAQAAMQKRNDLPSTYALLRSAGQGPFGLQNFCNWSKWRIGITINMGGHKLLPIVKLRGSDREAWLNVRYAIATLFFLWFLVLLLLVLSIKIRK